jgi:hypothetical protein
MATSTTVKSQKRRGPAPTGKGYPVMLRLQPDLLEAVDRFISEEKPAASRPEAIRLALREWAIGMGYLPPPGNHN